jgi:hypothetical protein
MKRLISALVWPINGPDYFNAFFSVLLHLFNTIAPLQRVRHAVARIYVLFLGASPVDYMFLWFIASCTDFVTSSGSKLRLLWFTGADFTRAMSANALRENSQWVRRTAKNYSCIDRIIKKKLPSPFIRTRRLNEVSFSMIPQTRTMTCGPAVAQTLSAGL